MNPHEQKTHKTALQDLGAAVDVFAERATQRMDDLFVVIQRVETLIHEERTARLKLAEEQRNYVDYEDRMLRQSIQGLQQQSVLVTSTFWERLRWMMTGR